MRNRSLVQLKDHDWRRAEKAYLKKNQARFLRLRVESEIGTDTSGTRLLEYEASLWRRFLRGGFHDLLEEIEVALKFLREKKLDRDPHRKRYVPVLISIQCHVLTHKPSPSRLLANPWWGEQLLRQAEACMDPQDHGLRALVEFACGSLLRVTAEFVDDPELRRRLRLRAIEYRARAASNFPLDTARMCHFHAEDFKGKAQLQIEFPDAAASVLESGAVDRARCEGLNLVGDLESRAPETAACHLEFILGVEVNRFRTFGIEPKDSDFEDMLSWNGRILDLARAGDSGTIMVNGTVGRVDLYSIKGRPVPPPDVLNALRLVRNHGDRLQEARLLNALRRIHAKGGSRRPRR
jgi:hypothetical protein